MKTETMPIKAMQTFDLSEVNVFKNDEGIWNDFDYPGIIYDEEDLIFEHEE